MVIETPGIHCYVDMGDGKGIVPAARETIVTLVAAQRAVWIEILSPGEADMRWLRESFKFHPLALSDVLNDDVRPKQEYYGDTLFTVFRAVNLNPGQDILDLINVSIFLRDNLLVTCHRQPVRTINFFFENTQTSRDLLAKGACHTYYLLLDGMVDRHFDVVEQIEDEVCTLEEQVFSPEEVDIRHQLWQTQKRVSFLKRSLTPEMEAVRNLVQSGNGHFTDETRMNLRDVLDHLQYLNDQLESYRDNLNGLMDSYLSQLTHKTNETMKILSVVATIMLPLTVITGIFGMNHEVMPTLKDPHGFWMVIGSMVVVAVGLLGYFKWRRLI